jgi:hypothetical protein
MEPISIVSLITVGIPFVTAGIKKLFGTSKIPDDYRSGVHALLPIIIGILSTGLYTYVQTNDWKLALVAGLGSGGAASSVRDIDKNLTGIVASISQILSRRKSNG